MTKTPPYNEYLGIELQHRESGRAEVALELGPSHLNLRGVAHGGVISSLLDSALGAAVISSIPDAWWCATTSLSVQFVGGAGPGQLTATGRVDRRGQRVAFASGEARDGRRRLVATAQGTWHLWPSRPGPDTGDGCVFVEGTGERIPVGKIVAVGRNYADHVKEMGGAADRKPVVFLKPRGALVASGATVEVPTSVGEVHHEVELVALIGKAGRAIRPEQALGHVRGFAVGIDLTLRDLQAEAKRRGESWCVAKGFDGSAPVSPVALRDGVGDGSGLEISLDVNGERRQQGNTSQMIHNVADLVAHVSRWMSLDAGDLLFTGTPAGVGPLLPGDRVDARIEKVGELSVTIAALEE